MAIDSYEPELAKRQKIEEIAEQQLRQAVRNFRSTCYDDFDELKQRLGVLPEALQDYQDAARSLVEWLETGQQKSDT